MSVQKVVVPALHSRLASARREAERMRELAVKLAEALDAQVDLRYGLRNDDVYVRRRTGDALRAARDEALL